MKQKITRLIFALAVTGCATTRAQFAPVTMNQTFAVRTPAEKVELFRSQTPTRKFSEIGAVNACCSTDSNLLIDLLREKASQNGGDAITDLEISAPGGASASVIRYE